jgi:hypothetical protein
VTVRRHGIVFVVAACLAAACASPPPAEPALPLAAPPRITEDNPIATSPPSPPPSPVDPPPPEPIPDPPPPPPPDVATVDPPPPPPPPDPAIAAAVSKSCPPAPPSTPPHVLSAGARAQWARPSRPLAMLVTEIQQLESLKQATPSTAPDRPVLEFRIATNYYELEVASYRECSQNATTTTMIEQRMKVMKAARKAATKQCAELKRDHPTFTPSRPCPTQ